MHIRLPETKVSRGVLLAVTLQGWCFNIHDSTDRMMGFNYIAYGQWPWRGPYANGAHTMVYCWNGGTYYHREYR